jgi:hypothetical protein
MSVNQKKLKLWIAVGFVTLFTAISIFAYVKILKPIRDGRANRTGKYTMKQGYKTQFNPDYLDSLEKAKKSKKPSK